MSGSVARKLPSWIAAFEEYCDGLSSPPTFKRWAALSCLAGALERKLWVRTLGSDLHPNLYVCFVAPPGIGKTVAISQTEHLWRGLTGHHVAPTSITKAALIDALNDATRRIVRQAEIPPFVEFNSLLIIAGELGVLIPGYDNDFMNTLTAIYDGHPYAERRRSKDLKFGIPAPQLNLLGATTPSYLNAVMPEGAWDQGFLSRTLLIYSGDRIIRNLFDERDNNEALYKELLSDLKIIGDYFGKCSFSPDAASAIGNWHIAGGPPVPDHPKLAHYLTRRTAHALKLCMVAAVSRIDFNFTIERDDVDSAITWLLEAEESMPDIFRAMQSGGDSAAIDECWHMVWQTHTREKKPVSEARIIAFLRTRVPSHSVEKILQIMIRSEMLIQDVSGGQLAYKPAPKLR
jgi:hypothetical protein